MVTFSFVGDGRVLKRLRRHFMAPKRVLWRRWRWPLLLAAVVTTLETWAGVNAAPRLEPVSTGWQAFVVSLVLFVLVGFLWYLVSRWCGVKRWANGPFPPPAGPEKGWYLREPVRARRLGLSLVALPMALLHAWIQVANGGGRTVDGAAAISAFFVWAGIIRGLIAAGEPAIAVTASGLFHSPEFHRWEQIRDLRLVGEEDDIILTTVDDQKWLLETPVTRLRGADVYNVINYYLVRPGARAGIAGAVWPSTVRRP